VTLTSEMIPIDRMRTSLARAAVEDGVTDQVMDILELYRKNPFNETFGNSANKGKIRNCVRVGQPITLVLPGFHGKTNNPDFVFGPSVDMGDKVAFVHLANLVKQIKSVYAPGAVLYLTHEGHFLGERCPLLGTSDDLDLYLRDFRSMTAGQPGIVSLSIYEMIPAGKTLAEKLQHFVDDYCPPSGEVREHIERDDHYRRLYTSYKKVNELNQRQFPLFRAGTVRAREARVKQLAESQLQTYLGFSSLLKSFFDGTEYIRLSALYKSPDFDECMAINYLPGVHHMSTPAFNCLVRTAENGYDFIRKTDAQSKNYAIEEEEGLKLFVAA
jgi:pyoverdine/dityrosine biosynthesis protein Dit1